MDLPQQIETFLHTKGIQSLHKPAGNAHGFEDGAGSEIVSFEYQTYPEIQTAVLWNFDVFAPYANRGIGTGVFSRLAQHFSDQGLKTIELMMVRHDGLTFWPRMGGVPHNVQSSQSTIRNVMAREETCETDILSLKAAYDLAQSDPIAAWHYLTEKGEGTSRIDRRIIEKLSQSMCFESTMIIDLDHPVVRGRLHLDSPRV